MTKIIQKRFYQFVIHIIFMTYVGTSWGKNHLELNSQSSTIHQWSINSKNIELRCLEGECSTRKRDIVIQKIVSTLNDLPLFLRTTKIKMLIWNELEPGTEPSGLANKQWDAIQIFSSMDGPIDRLLIHEITHLNDETDHTLGLKFLKIRFYSKEYQKLLFTLWHYIRSINEPMSSKNIDQNITQFLVQNKMLRRGSKDVHASDVYEYWAVAVEIYYIHNKGSKLIALDEVLDREEIQYLSRLKWK